ncbi:hypothetical protein J3F84DRAFT_20239 [Trichoderma pleuroticola]
MPSVTYCHVSPPKHSILHLHLQLRLQLTKSNRDCYYGVLAAVVHQKLFTFSSAPLLPGPQPQQMRGLSPGALHRTAARASPPATHILASSWPPPLAPPPRPAAPDRLFVRSQALRSFVPPLDQLGSNRRALGRLADSSRHHLAPKPLQTPARGRAFEQ